MASVVAIGEALIELRDSGPNEVRWTFAGDTLNCAAALGNASPLSNVRYLTGVGTDEMSRRFLEFCRSVGVDADDAVRVADASLGLYWIQTRDGANRFAYWRDDSAARRVLRAGGLTVDDVRAELIVVSGITLAVAGPAAGELLGVVEQARAHGARVAYDTNHRPALWADAETAREVNEAALGVADIVHASSDDIAILWADDARFRRLVADRGVAELVVTDGPRPTVVTHGGKDHRSTPNVVDVVDSAGAGDAFFGTYLGRRISGESVEASLESASATATQVVQCAGALGYLAAAG